MAPLITAAAVKFGASAATAATIGKVASTALIVGGTALDVVGTLTAGREAERVAGVEAELGEAQAAQERARTADEELRRRRAAVKLAGAQRAGFAAEGIDISTGTPLLVVAETLLEAQEDVEAIRETGRAKAKTFKVKAQTFRDFGKAQLGVSRIRAGTSLLTGLSRL